MIDFWKKIGTVSQGSVHELAYATNELVHSAGAGTGQRCAGGGVALSGGARRRRPSSRIPVSL